MKFIKESSDILDDREEWHESSPIRPRYVIYSLIRENRKPRYKVIYNGESPGENYPLEVKLRRFKDAVKICEWHELLKETL